MKNFTRLAKKFISKTVEEDKPTIADKAADKMAAFVGSWLFLILFAVFFVCCILYNPWDKFPFILLNLFLSCFAAIQASIIMISANRIAKIDKKIQQSDFYVNVKTDLVVQEILKRLDELEKQ